MIAAASVWISVMLLLGFIYVRLSRHALDPLALFCYLFFFFYVFRETAITLGFDKPYPDDLFLTSQTSGLLFTAGLGLISFLVAFIGAYLIYQPFASGSARFLPVAWNVPSVRKQVRLVSMLTIVATVISVVLLGRYGGVAGVISAGKRTGSLAGSFELRIFPALGAVIAASLGLTLWQGREAISNRSQLAVFAVCAAVLNSGYVMLWGSRQAAAVVLLILTAGRWLLTRDDEEVVKQSAVNRNARPRLMRLLAVGLIVVLAVTGLRVARDAVLIGHTASSIQGQSTVRQISVASNSTYFDAVLLAMRDWPATHPYRGGKDFIVGAEAAYHARSGPGNRPMSHPARGSGRSTSRHIRTAGPWVR